MICETCNEPLLTKRELWCSLKCKLLGGIEINQNDCWIWIKNSSRHRYGRLCYKNKWYAAHKVSYEMFKGDNKGKDIIHTCKKFKCINPAHLMLENEIVEKTENRKIFKFLKDTLISFIKNGYRKDKNGLSTKYPSVD